MSQFPEESGPDGSFERQEDAFRDWVEDREDATYPAEAGRYHLYVSLACPWAHRIVLYRELKELTGVIGMSVVDPIRTDEEGWAFRQGPGLTGDLANGFAFLKEAYLASDPGFKGRVTVPVLWDMKTRRIVSNSDDDLMRMFNHVFDRCGGKADLDFYPLSARAEIDRLNQIIYETVNNGVYRAGFATTQAAYEAALFPLFDTLDMIETRLSRQDFLIGNQITETDWRLFVTLIRFDAVYHGHFKCNLRRIIDYPNLSCWLRRLYHVPKVAATVNFDHIKRHYYCTHDEINPTRIVPAGPDLEWLPGSA